MVVKQIRLFHGLVGIIRPRGEFNPRWKPKIPKFCLICGKSFSVVPSKATKAKYCSRSCQNKGFSVRFSWQNNPKCKGKVHKICEICGKEFWVWPCSDNTAKFCSNSCRGKAGTVRISPNELSERNRRAMQILWNTPEARARLLEIRRQPEYQLRRVNKQKQFYLAHPERHTNRIIAQRQLKGKGGISKGHFALFEKIKAIFTDAELNYPVKTNGHVYFIDVGIPSFGVGYEYDGEHWHQNAKKDRKRDRDLKEAGWKVAHIKEKEVKAWKL